MASVDRKWLPPILIAVAFLASVAVYSRLPAMIGLQFGTLLPFGTAPATGQASRLFVLLVMPATALLVWIAFRLAPTAGGQRLARRMLRHAPEEVTSPDQFERFGKTYDAIVLSVVILVLGFHAAVMAAALQVSPAIVSRILPAVIGACLILMGNVMPRLRANWVAGIRTRRTLENPQLWRSTHRVFGAAFVVSGFATIIAAAVAPQWGILVAIASVLASCIVGGVASARGKAISVS
jgi:hypothetical protein